MAAADFRPGDWICATPNCQNHNFARQTTCRRCGQLRPAEGVALPANFRPGDWICPTCTNHNFARNSACRRCGSANVPLLSSMATPLSTVMAGPAAMMAGRPLPPTFRAGDWMCNSCNAHNYASRTACHECEEAKPKDAEQHFNPANFAYGAGYAASVGYAAPFAATASTAYAQALHLMANAYSYAAPMAAYGTLEWKPGDWACASPQCGFHNFARQATCKQCGSAKPEEGGAMPVADSSKAAT